MALAENNFVLDTNIVLYTLGNQIQEPLPTGNYSISVITEMELLSYPNLSQAEFLVISEFISNLTVINLSQPIKTLAIELRQKNRIKLPDAIIAATAVTLEAILLTNDRQLLNLGIKARSLLIN